MNVRFRRLPAEDLAKLLSLHKEYRLLKRIIREQLASAYSKWCFW